MPADTVLVTGAASGIGRSTVELLLAEGRAVIGVDLDAARIPDGAVGRPCDLSDPTAVDALVDDLRGAASTVVNCAGVPGTHPRERVLAVNLLAPRRLALGLGPGLGRAGCIVNVASVAAQRSAVPDADVADVLARDDAGIRAWHEATDLDGAATYDLTKKALVALTLQLCAGWLGAGPRALSVSPGPTETPILADFAASMGADRMQASADRVGGHATARDVAAVIAFAVSPAARWLNGIDVRVDGGLIGARQAGTAAAGPVTSTNP